LEYFDHKLANFVAPPTDESAKFLVRCKAYGENSAQIDALLATLSFLKVVKNDKKCGSEFVALL